MWATGGATWKINDEGTGGVAWGLMRISLATGCATWGTPTSVSAVGEDVASGPVALFYFIVNTYQFIDFIGL